MRKIARKYRTKATMASTQGIASILWDESTAGLLIRVVALTIRGLRA